MGTYGIALDHSKLLTAHVDEDSKRAAVFISIRINSGGVADAEEFVFGMVRRNTTNYLL
jgi:hypothetical protein